MEMGFGEKTWFECVECDGRWTNSNGLEFDDKPGGMGWTKKLVASWGIRWRAPRGRDGPDFAGWWSRSGAVLSVF